MKILKKNVISKSNLIIALPIFILAIAAALLYLTQQNHTSIESMVNFTSQNVKNQQWYYQNDGSFDTFVNDDMAWETDKKVALPNIDIDFASFPAANSKRKITIAVIDTDIDYNHESIKNSIWNNSLEKIDAMDNDQNGYVDDIMGWNFVDNNNQLFNTKNYSEHGTYISGILVGSNNANHFKGMLKNRAEIMCLKALNNNQSGKMNHVIKAIEYAEASGATICVMAFSTYDQNKQLDKMIQNSKMLFVVPSGNDGIKLDNELMTYPAGYQHDNIISVADIRCDGHLSATSNYGEGIDIAAPGTDIMTTSPFNQYMSANGTSLAVPFVAGTAALLYSHSPNILSAKELKDSILSHARKVNSLEGKVRCNGIVDVKATLSSISK